MEQITSSSFTGFLDPRENWSKLPHQFIEALPLVETLGELKCILYILRHTWGFHDDDKKITIDEFSNGRKRKNRTRFDNGVGMSGPAIIDGLKRAEEHGFIEISVDNSDLGRIKKFYSLKKEVLKDLIPDQLNLNASPNETLPRSEKDTLERNLEKKLIDAGASTPRDFPLIPNSGDEKKPLKTKQPIPPAITVFREVRRSFPPKETWETIANTVGEESDKLELWRNVLIGYALMGWNPRNVAGALEYFLKGEVPSPRDNGNGKLDPSQYPPEQFAAMRQTLVKLARADESTPAAREEIERRTCGVLSGKFTPSDAERAFVRPGGLYWRLEMFRNKGTANVPLSLATIERRIGELLNRGKQAECYKMKG